MITSFVILKLCSRLCNNEHYAILKLCSRLCNNEHYAILKLCSRLCNNENYSLPLTMKVSASIYNLCLQVKVVIYIIFKLRFLFSKNIIKKCNFITFCEGVFILFHILVEFYF